MQKYGKYDYKSKYIKSKKVSFKKEKNSIFNHMQKIRKNNYTRFLGSLIKKGNKIAARNILTETLLKLTKKRSAKFATKQRIHVKKSTVGVVNLVTSRKKGKKVSKKHQAKKLKKLKNTKKRVIGGYSLFNAAFSKLDNAVEIKKVP